MNETPIQPYNDREIDLSDVSRKIGKKYDDFNMFLYRSIRFVIKNAIVLILLLAIGVGLGTYLDSAKYYDNEVIVAPNFGSADYMYDKVAMIDAKIKERDTVFLKNIGIADPLTLKGITIKPILDVYRFVYNNDTNFQMLKLMADDGDLKKTVEESSTSKNFKYHRITFTTLNRSVDRKIYEPLMAYLNNSSFFEKQRQQYVINAYNKIASDAQTINQINGLMDQFGKSANGGSLTDGKLVYYSENTQLNDVIKTKELLVDEMGNYRVELLSMDQIVKPVHKSSNIRNKESLNGKMKLALPLILIGLFLLGHLFVSFYRKQALRAKILDQI